MKKRSEEKFAKFFAKAFHEVVIPELKDIGEDVKDLQKTVDGMDRKITKLMTD